MTFYKDKVSVGKDGSLSVVIIVDEASSITFFFSDIDTIKRHEANAIIQAIVHFDKDLIQFSGRVNMLSLSGRESFARQLNKAINKKISTDLYLSRAIEAVLEHLKSIGNSQSFYDIEPMLGEEGMLFDPFITDKSANLIFGDGSGGKTWVTMRWAISLVTGAPFLGYKPQSKCNVLFLDYEDKAKKFQRRIQMLCNGMEEEFMQDDLNNLRYLNPKGIPLHDLVNPLKKEIALNKIDLLIIDSAAYACGAEVEKADATIKYFNALESLNISSLAIAHVSKGTADQNEGNKGQMYALGSIYWHNAPRNIWNVAKLENGSSVKKACLFHRKCNDGVLQGMFPLEISFPDKKTARIEKGNSEDWMANWTLEARILYALKQDRMGRKELKSELGKVNDNSFNSALKRLKEEGKIELLGGRGGEYKLA